MSDGFDISELTNFEKKLVNLAEEKMPRESKKFLKKQGGKLSKKNKAVYKSMGIGEGSGTVEKGFKAGKVYKYNDALAVRAYNGILVEGSDGQKYPLGAMLNNGFRHVNKDGTESFVVGYHFMEKALESFDAEYTENIREFLDEVLDKGL